MSLLSCRRVAVALDIWPVATHVTLLSSFDRGHKCRCGHIKCEAVKVSEVQESDMTYLGTCSHPETSRNVLVGSLDTGIDASEA